MESKTCGAPPYAQHFAGYKKSLRPSITRGGGCELKYGGGAGAARRV